MLKAKKDNVTYRIREEDKEKYIARGFDILNENGRLIAAGSKGLSAEEAKTLKESLNAAKEEVNELKAEIETLKALKPSAQ